MTNRWKDQTLIGFDTETSGQYPLTAEICEIAAVKWRNGEIIDEFQTLIATKKRMSDKVISIHNITNEMLAGAPTLKEAISGFHKFIQGGYLVAHHAPFDLGFIAPEFEFLKLPLPKDEVFCSSLLARKAFPESENHKLQTLIRYFKLPQGKAHRALDDAKACLEVGLRVFEKVGANATIDELLRYQEAKLPWSDYGVASFTSHPVYGPLVNAMREDSWIQIVYSGGSRPGQPRTVKPIGLVRNPLDDYLVAFENEGEIPKRYFLKRITAARR